MTADNFEACLAETLKWEGAYSNDADDPGGPTMKGIIQREYDAWRKKQGKGTRPVRQISEDEVRTIYRTEYWDALDCDSLPAGVDLCVFDAGVNSGVGRARQWYARAQSIDAFCDERLGFLQRLGRLWRVFGAGWARRVAGIRHKAHLMEGLPSTPQEEPTELHAGMHNEAVRTLQIKLRALGYPCGMADAIYGEQVYRAVVLFQHDNDLQGEPGIWLPAYNTVLATAKPMLLRRQDTTAKDLDQAGDGPVRHFNVLQRIFAWLFGASAAAQIFDGQSVMESVSGVRDVVEPAHGLILWLGTNRWLLVAAGCLALIALIRIMRSQHVAAFQSFTYQGEPK
jgi:lysozyme family protein